MKNRVAHKTLTRPHGDPIVGLFAEMVEDGDCTAILVPDLQKPLEEWDKGVHLVLISTPQDEVEWIEDDEDWPRLVNLRLQHLPMLLYREVEAIVIQELEGNVGRKV